MRRRPYYLLWLLLPLLTFGALRGPSTEQRQMIRDIDDGSVLAWAEHITGQDPNDLTSFDKFESIAIIPGTSNRAYGDLRTDDELWAVVKREVNGVWVRYVEQFQPLDWGPDPNYCWFVDCAGGTTGTAGTPGIPAVAATHTYYWFQDDGVLWGVPVTDRTLLCLDAAGAAVNLGGGVTGLPYTNNPFVTGETVRINGTTNYDGAYVLQAGTSATQLRILKTYNAETFAGTETVIKLVAGISASTNGRMVRDSDGNLYYDHPWRVADGTCVTKIGTDGTLNRSFLTWPFAGDAATWVKGLAITADDAYLYVLTAYPGRCTKFSLATGVSVWSAALGTERFNLAIDAAGNAYVPIYGGVARLAAADGAQTILTTIGAPAVPLKISSVVGYATAVDDAASLVAAAGFQFCNTSEGATTINQMYNLAVRTLDDSVGGQVCVGTTYESGTITSTRTIGAGCMVVRDGYIYVLISTSGATTEIYKYQWTGSALTEVTHIAGPAYGCGLYFDLWGNLVCVNQDWTVHQEDLLYFYDTDLTLLSNLDGLYPICLAWDVLAGGALTQGGACSNGALGTPGVPGTPGTTASPVGPQLDARAVCVYADAISRGTFTMDGNDIKDFNEADYTTIIAGLNYFSILETTDLHRMGTLGKNATIKTVQGNFYETLGVHVGYDKTYSADWRFFKKDRLMKDGAARNIGGGVVGLPYSGEPFTAGEEVYIYGSTNYSGLHTLAADTNNVELRITATYTAETFDGTEWVVSNTPPDLFSGYKGPAPFLRGTNRKPKVYLWIWDPLPMTLRSLTTEMEMTFE